MVSIDKIYLKGRYFRVEDESSQLKQEHLLECPREDFLVQYLLDIPVLLADTTLVISADDTAVLVVVNNVEDPTSKLQYSLKVDEL